MKPFTICLILWLAILLPAFADPTLQSTEELAVAARANLARILAGEKHASIPYLGHRLTALSTEIDSVKTNPRIHLANGRKIMDEVLALYDKVDGKKENLKPVDDRLLDLLKEIHRAMHR